MKKSILIFLLLFLATFGLFAQTTKNMTWNGKERQYLEYVPESYQQGVPSPVLFMLHGLGGNMTDAFNTFGFKKIADDHGWILITPQALDAYIALIGANIGTAWDAGVSADISAFIPNGGTVIVNQGVDDCGFLMAILDDLIANYSVDENNVFVTGFSMGGFMTNRLAIEHGDRIKAAASVSGTIGNEMKNSVPVTATNMMHIHGTADDVVNYNNAALSYNGLTLPVGIGAEATVRYWRDFNGCDTTAVLSTYDNTANDNLTFDRYEYKNGINGTRNCFIKVNNGAHTWYYTPANDIDYTTEIYKFFASFMEGYSVADNEENIVTVTPNPSNGFFAVSGENIRQIEVFDISGNKILMTENSTINLTDYSSGVYLFEIKLSNGGVVMQKAVLAR